MTEREAINSIINSIRDEARDVVNKNEGLGIFDTGKIDGSFYLKGSSMPDRIPPSLYYVCAHLLEHTIVCPDGTGNVVRRLVPGDEYLICYLHGKRPVVLDRLVRGDNCG